MNSFDFDSHSYQDFKHEAMESMNNEFDTHSFCHADSEESCLFNLIQNHMDTVEFWGHGKDIHEVHKIALAFEEFQNSHHFSFS